MPSNEEFLQKILQSHKYRALHLPPETIQDLIDKESLRHPDAKSMQESVRQKLHQLTALYLGDPDYEKALEELRGIQGKADLEAFAERMLNAHTSTRERLPYINGFYSKIFQAIGTPHSILDLACGLNPFALPWMGLNSAITYLAYDIHQPRVDLLNAFFEKAAYPQAQATQHDILVNPPTQKADVAFFFKEAHRMEQRRKSSNRILWEALQVNTLLVSLPTRDIAKTHDMLERMRNLVMETIHGKSWLVEEILFEDEIVFCIHKGAG
jgi:16S rRNA (guanine(1405)-N(7))-methyltransferase